MTTLSVKVGGVPYVLPGNANVASVLRDGECVIAQAPSGNVPAHAGAAAAKGARPAARRGSGL